MPSPTVLPVRQRTPEWLEARMDGIGASEAAAAVGMSQWQSRIGLWAHKLGLTPPPEPTMPMLLGVELEPFIARRYTEQTGVKIRRANNLRQHPEHRFMLASIDRRAGRKPIELKYSDRATGYGEPGTDEVPDEVLCQVLHQLAVLDEPEGEVALLRPSRAELAIYVIRREPVAETALIEEEAVLWDHVQSRTEPPIDGSESTHRTLNALYHADPAVVLEADEILASDLVALREARRIVDGWDATRAEIEARVKAAMVAAGASVVRAPGIGSIPWRQPKDSQVVDWKTLATAYRSTIERLRAAGGDAGMWIDGTLSEGFGTTSLDDVVALHTTTKANTPRFGPPQWEQEEEIHHG